MSFLMASGAIILGLILLVFGAERFVAGASVIARYCHVSPLVIGLTLVAFGTSAPEIVVAIIASIQGNPGLAIGNAVGSNIANIGLVLGLTALVAPVFIHSRMLRREYPFLLGVSLLTWFLCSNAYLSFSDGLILFAAFIFYFIWLIWTSVKKFKSDPLQKEFAEEIVKKMSFPVSLFWTLFGLILLPLGAEILVHGAVTLAALAGVSDLIIGLTIVAIGTSLPEVATSIASVLKDEGDIAVGNIIGSNVFNLLAVVATAAVINPTSLGTDVVWRDLSVMIGFTVALFFVALSRSTQGKIGRFKGFLLLFAYIVYLGLLTYSTLA